MVKQLVCKARDALTNAPMTCMTDAGDGWNCCDAHGGRALQRVEEAGLEVLAVMCLVDREQGAARSLADYRFEPLFTASDLGL